MNLYGFVSKLMKYFTLLGEAAAISTDCATTNNLISDFHTLANLLYTGNVVKELKASPKFEQNKVCVIKKTNKILN